MGYETINRRAHVMTRKNTLKSLPTDTEFRVVGLDLAKSDVPNSELSDLIWLKVMSLLLPYQWMTTLRLWSIE